MLLHCTISSVCLNSRLLVTSNNIVQTNLQTSSFPSQHVPLSSSFICAYDTISFGTFCTLSTLRPPPSCLLIVIFPPPCSPCPIASSSHHPHASPPTRLPTANSLPTSTHVLTDLLKDLATITCLCLSPLQRTFLADANLGFARRTDLWRRTLGSRCRLPRSATSSSIRLPPLFGIDPFPFQRNSLQGFSLPRAAPPPSSKSRRPSDSSLSVGSSESQLLLSFRVFQESASFLFPLRSGVLPPVHLFFQVLASATSLPRRVSSSTHLLYPSSSNAFSAKEVALISSYQRPKKKYFNSPIPTWSSSLFCK